MSLPANLPSVSDARLPATYEHAKTALSECVEIDECRDWADKAEAIASYAKQAGDETLRRMADRMRAYLVERGSERLLVPIQNMTDGEIEERATRYEAISLGAGEHADELRRFKHERAEAQSA